MSNLSALEQRLEAALQRLEGGRNKAHTADGTQERVAELEAENRRLSDTVESLQSQRSKDLAELDTLIAQLRPLIEEAG